MRSTLALCSFALMLASCGDDPLTKLLPSIAVDPESINFGDGVVDQDNLVMLTVLNRGSGILEISAYEIEQTELVFEVRNTVDVLGAFAEKDVTVVFRPRAAHAEYSGVLLIHSNDSERAELRVPLEGVGGVREIEVFPASIDFGTVNEGTPARRPVELRNIGKDPLAITSVTWTSTSSDMYVAPGAFMQGVLLPGTSTTVEIVYAPEDLNADSGVLTIASNDEDEPSIDVPVRGRANLAPRAIAWGCDKPITPGAAGCDGETKVRSMTASLDKFIGLDGRESADPEGGPLIDYRWVIVNKPASSGAAIFHSTEDFRRMRATGDIQIDRIGHYDLRLIVKDERGVESLDRAESHVLVLPRDLEIALRWEFGTDVDLHVVQPGGLVGDYGSGQAYTSTGSDCSSFNRRPNWSDLATERDDPSLDKDDVSGSGPEVVSLDRPEAGRPYSVYAHYCNSHNRPSPVGVVIEVFVRGELVGMVPATGQYPLVTGEVWEGARVVWSDGVSGPSATVEDRSDQPPIMAPGLCLSP